MNRYKKLKFVGEGSFARVYKVLDKKTQQIIALKCIKKDGKSEVEIDKLMEEIMILQSLSHKNIIKIKEWFVTETEICVLTEFAEKGELFKIIKKKENKVLSEFDIKVIAKQLVCALQFLHDSRVIHRDIKPQNILLSADNTVKLCDFGFARALSEESTMATSIKGTPLYMAPELVQEKPYNDKVDLWSLGVIVYELFYGKPPFYTNSIYKLVRMIVKEHIKYPAQPVISKEFQHFINGLLQKNPLKRFNIEHLHKHIFLQITDTQQTHKTTPKRKQVIKLKKNTYSHTYLKQINYQKKLKRPKSSPYLNVNNKNVNNNKENRLIKEKEKENEAKDEEINYSSSHSSPKSNNSSVISLNEKENTAGNAVRQKILDILHSNDWKMIDKILIVLPQRWHSFCSLSNSTHNISFELKLFHKLYDLLSNTQSAVSLKNIINVMRLIIIRIQNTKQCAISSFVDIIRNTLHYVQTYMYTMEFFPILCTFIKVTIHLKNTIILNIMMKDDFISWIMRNFIQNESNHHEITANVIDIICELMQHHRLDFYIINTADSPLKLSAFSTLSMNEIPMLMFWNNICTHICSNTSLLNNVFMNIFNTNQKSKHTLKFVLYLLMTSCVIRNEFNNTQRMKELVLIHIINNKYLTQNDDNDHDHDLQYDTLLLLYHIDNIFQSNTIHLQNVYNQLYTLSSNSSNIYISNISRSILIKNDNYFDIDSKNLWQIILSSSSCIDNEHLFSAKQDSFIYGQNVFSFWCNSLSNICIADNMKLCITISLQLFAILSSRIHSIVNKDISLSSSHIVSATSLNILLNFVQQIFQILISPSSSSISNINSQQTRQIIKQFLSSKHIQTLCILGNAQFILEYMCQIPFHIDTLYTELIQCCNLSYDIILLIYRYLASQYCKTLSISPSFATPNHNKKEDKLIYNFHKISLEFQLISSILNYIQISPPAHKESACNLLFYITWKQSLFMREFLCNNGLLIVTNCIMKQRQYHSNNIIIQVLQIISCTARKYQKFATQIEESGCVQLILKYLLNDSESGEIKEKICNLIGNLCKHSDKFLDLIKKEDLLRVLCKCTHNKLSPNIRRFACYAIGNIAYQYTKKASKHDLNHLIVCIAPLSLRLMDKDYKTQENAAGAIGNLLSQNDEIIAHEIIKNNVIKLLLNQISGNIHLCVVRNCLYSLSNICHFTKCRKEIAAFGWRHILKNCIDKFGHKDPFVKKCAFKILRKMESKRL